MHELSYATSILNSLLEAVENQKELGRKPLKVSEINLEVGELTLIQMEQLKFAFEVIAEDTICNGMKFNIEYIKPQVQCKDCGYEGDVVPKDEIGVYCPKCNSMHLKIKGGKEFNIKNAILEFDDEE
ncbi:hydrogenase nickel incorporation protein HypA/HybF [Methanococcus voltae]|uniref:hydrogenase maturation nickel metallochaperone HypA n=1 Tax=Methanococcus voltae TaxID=2188 RepID=UPI001AE43DDD|nr:hydrogenase maturation nickel metallochaperone HypA [Methanococcus voltae]MBP2143199.1 hydrogenase nickel incorporation protein HypA/HybF [Methanococcus voltae]